MTKGVVGRGVVSGGVVPVIPFKPAQNRRLAITSATTDGSVDSFATQMIASGTAKTLPTLSQNNAALVWTVETVPSEGAFVYFIPTYATTSEDFTFTAEYSLDTSNGADGSWSAATVNIPLPDSASKSRRAFWVDLPTGTKGVKLNPTRTAGTAINWQFGAFKKALPGTRLDAHLVIGASLEDDGCKPGSMRAATQVAFPDRDPLFFTYARSGYNSVQTKDLALAALPIFDSVIGTVLFETGGNTITSNRPYFDDSDFDKYDRFENTIRTAIAAILSAGKNCLTCGITYRNYKTTNPVNGAANQENGSLPYNLNHVYPVIQQLLPDQFDATLSVPRGDAYSWTIAWREYQDGDGIHGSTYPEYYAGIRSEIWVRQLMTYLYTGVWPTSVSETLVAATEVNRQSVRVSLALDAINALPASPSRTSMIARLNALTATGVWTANPTISGTLEEGQTLTATPGAWTGANQSFTWQWFRNGAAIPGATGTTYLLQPADGGQKVSVGQIPADFPNAIATSAQTGTILATSFYDDFEREDGNLTPSANWSRTGGNDTAFLIVGGNLAANDAVNGAIAKCPSVGQANHGVEATIASQPTSTDGPFISCRLNNQTNYVGLRYVRVSSVNRLELYKRIASTFTSIGTFPVNIANGGKMAMEVFGQDVRVYADGVLQGTRTLVSTDLPTEVRQGVVNRQAVKNPWISDFRAYRISA